ncbi:MAG TPA: 1-deoxy-D-xylulose-5-phosphate reductoisomerase [Burkholderiaceae bacterium]|nr:1-deoxy-D-xylulose-5-phosphate reductoisomerase [Burkholderiaceae bacterium]
MKTLTILGATGSIGLSTLDIVERHVDRFRLHALTAHSRVDELAALCLRFRPAVAVVATHEAAERLKTLLSGTTVRVMHGEQALIEVATTPEVDAVMAAIVGGAGLAPTLAAAKAGKDVLLANKESLVMAGALLIDTAKRHGARLLPVDSEHNAIFQCLPHDERGWALTHGVSRLLLTASGGPFRTASAETIAHASPAQAIAHPNWLMGPKISVDSASMMNKGLELIEARWLFDLPAERLDVLVHPQSVVHSLVEFDDGSVLAQLGSPDMRTPIAYAMAYPERIASGSPRLDLARAGALTFEPPDLARFPCLRLAQHALASGSVACIALNAANEVAVAEFLSGRISFGRIAAVIEDTLARPYPSSCDSLEAIVAIDRLSREHARDAICAFAV